MTMNRRFSSRFGLGETGKGGGKPAAKTVAGAAASHKVKHRRRPDGEGTCERSAMAIREGQRGPMSAGAQHQLHDIA